MSVTRGKDFKLFYNSAVPAVPPSPPSPPSWVELTNCRDVNRGLTKDTADASSRISDFRAMVGTLRNMELTTEIIYDPSDPNYQVLEAHFFNDENIEILDMDNALSVVGAKGLKAEMQVTDFSVSEGLEEVGVVSITLVPGYTPDNPPIAVEVTVAGSVTPSASLYGANESQASVEEGALAS